MRFVFWTKTGTVNHVTRKILDDYPQQAKTGRQLEHLQTATGFGAGQEFYG